MSDYQRKQPQNMIKKEFTIYTNDHHPCRFSKLVKINKLATKLEYTRTRIYIRRAWIKEEQREKWVAKKGREGTSAVGKRIGEQCGYGVKATAEFQRERSKKGFPLLFSAIWSWALTRPNRTHGPRFYSIQSNYYYF